MWQILVFAAVLGTGLLAKRFLIEGELKGSMKEGSGSNDEGVSGSRICGFGKRNGVEYKGLKKRGRRGFVALKKKWRSFGKCRSASPSSAGKSFFNWSLGVGVMYILSAGKDEMNKLNQAVDEATECVNRLKYELHKRKLSSSLQDSACKNRFTTNFMQSNGKNKQEVTSDSNVEECTKVPVLCLIDDVECASSVLNEELQHDLPEIERLEAELESELQKLSQCTSEKSSGYNERTSNWVESFHARTISSESYIQPDPEHFMYPTNSVHPAEGLLVSHILGRECNAFQFHGVSPSDQDRELSHLLSEQRECRIVELESKLHATETQLSEKITELQQLKNCIHHIKNLSIQTSDEEPEEVTSDVDQELSDGVNLISLVDDSSKVSPSRQKALIGMKRPIEYAPCSCNSVHCE